MTHQRTAAAYIRVSTDEQTELSPESQLKEIRRYAAQHGTVVLEEHIYVDTSSGRSTGKRPEFNRMIGAAKQQPKPFDAILMWKYSRFARDREDSIVYKSLLRKDLGIEVISVSEKLGDDTISRLIEAFIEAMDEYYSINLGAEVRRGMREKASRGGIVSVAGYGYRVEDGNYIIHAEEAGVIRRLFDDYLSGTGIRELAVRLNNRGIHTSRGGLWENRTVEYILRNPVYTGKIRWNPERRTGRNFGDNNIMVTQGTHEAIITDEVFSKAQKRLDSVKAIFRKGEHHVPKQSDFMLRGLVRCSVCDCVLVQAVRGVSLQCHGYAHGKCRISHSVLIRNINRMVIRRIKEDFSTLNLSITRKTEADAVNSRIDSLNTKLSRAMDAYENGVYGLDELIKRRTKIENDINNLEMQKTAPQEPFQGATDIVFLDEPDLSETEKNLALRQMIARIVFNRRDNEITVYYR